MKKLLLILSGAMLLMCMSAYLAVTVVPIRGTLLQVFSGDTCKMTMSGNYVRFTTNQTGYVFDKPISASLNNNISDTSRTWTGALTHDKMFIYYATGTSVDTLKTNQTIAITGGGIPGSCEIKEMVGDGSHSPILSACSIVSGVYDPTLGVRNILTFLRGQKSVVYVSIVQKP